MKPSRNGASWFEVTLGEIAHLVGGGTPSRTRPQYFGSGIDWVTPSDLAPIGEVRPLGVVAEAVTEVGLNSSSAKRIPPGSVLFSSRASIGKIAVTDRECATNQGFINFLPRANRVDPWFLAYLLRHHTPSLIGLAGETTYKEVSRRKAATLKVCIPDLVEQRRIVDRVEECLDRVEEIERLREEACKEVVAVFPSLLAQGFSALAHRYPAAMIGDVAVDLQYGTSRKCHTIEKGTPVLRIPNVARGLIDTAVLKFCELEKNELENVVLRRGDLLIVRTNGSRGLVGRCAVFEEDDRQYAFASYLIRIRVRGERVDPRFLSLFLQSTLGRDAIAQRRRTSAGQYNINSASLRTIEFPCPPMDVQERVVEEMIEQRAIALAVEREQIATASEAEGFLDAVLRKAFAGEL